MTASENPPSEAPGRRRRSPLRLALQVFGILLLVVVSGLIGGFLVFADRVASARPPERPTADGIVALTGGAQRIDDAASLLMRGSAERLLISGVNEHTSGGALAAENPRLGGVLNCCVDIGREARDTRGNALEAGKWARDLGYSSLIVVTSAYHMPRSLAEIASELPGVRLVPYPVNPDGLDYAAWRSDPEVFKLLIFEYSKYVVSRLA